MKTIRKLTRAAAVSLAALVVLLAGPADARAEDCTANYIACIAENGGSTQCQHEYILCVAGSVREF